MASKDKPKTKSLLGKSGTPRPQPIRATQPFQLLQGSPARKSPSSSPTPRSNAAWQTGNHQRWSPDHRSSPDRGDRKSPSSPSIKAVQNRRSPSPSIRRTTTSLDPIGPYLTGQWPRESMSLHQHSSMRDKQTQTPDWSVEGNSVKSSSKNTRSSSSIPDANGPFPELKQMRQQIRRIGKSSRHNDKKERSPPVHGNHAALQQLPAKSQTKSTPITIGGQTFGRVPKRQNSAEALNKEIDEYTSNPPSGELPGRLFQGITPPDGHRAPLPRSSTTRSMETQTPQEYVDGGHSPTPSPTVTPQVGINLPKTVFDVEVKDAGISPCPKYASSPRPNNSYMFKREPPEGAERPYIKEEIAREVSPGCPDKNKVNFYPYISSAFASVKKNSKMPAVILVPEQNNNTATLTPPRNSPLNLANPQPQVLVDFSEPRM